MNRGDRRECIFQDDEVRHRFSHKDQLRQRGWTEAELGRRRKGDPEKVEIASPLRAHTTMTLQRIAQRLAMGTWTYVSNCLVQKRKNERKCQ
ncbi:MAG TPA: hypothetical protein PKW32_14325 [Verrucomicrobiota bacterium]|nr:hypothetical protein [Verrucomicrobiota bacterium]